MKPGGLSRRMTYVRGVQCSGVDPLLVDGGDFLFSLGDSRGSDFRRRQNLEKSKARVSLVNSEISVSSLTFTKRIPD